MLRMRRMGSCPCKQPGRPIARFHSDPSGKCLAGRSTALRRLPIARAIGGAPRPASHPGKAPARLPKNFEQGFNLTPDTPATQSARIASHNPRARGANTQRQIHPKPKETFSMTRTIQQLFDLTGKTALVTGGSRGPGLQLAHALGEAGAKIMLSSRKASDLEEPAEDHPVDAWDKVMNLNVRGYFILSQHIAKHSMIARRSGSIINVASIAGLGGNPKGMNTIAYNTSKGAVINFTRALAAEWGAYN